MSDKYNITLQTFPDHLQSMLRNLYQKGEYADVTLVSDDIVQFKAHRIVLSAYSPFLKETIERKQNQFPLINLRDVQSYELETILQLMYLGEGRICQGRMEEFIKVANVLKAKDILEKVKINIEDENYIENETNVEGYDEEEKMLTEPYPNIELETNAALQKNHSAKEIICPDCGVLFKERKTMLSHFRTKHKNQKVLHHCDYCEYQSTKKGYLRQHIQAIHEGITYPCNQCDYKATQQTNLKTHINSQHEGLIYPCIQCDFKGSTKNILKIHIQSKHEGIRYPCIQCEYQATTQDHLQSHIYAKHSDYILKCDHCDYQTKWRQHFNKHKRTAHAINV